MEHQRLFHNHLSPLCQSLFRNVVELSCSRGKKPFNGRRWWRCHIIHPRIASGDIYREAVGLRAANTPALETLRIHRLSDPFLNVARQACILFKLLNKMENSTYTDPIPNLLLQTELFVWTCYKFICTFDCIETIRRILRYLMSAMLKPICDICKSSMTHEAGHHQALTAHMMHELMLYPACMRSVPKARLNATVTKAHSAPGLERRGKGQLSSVSWF